MAVTLVALAAVTVTALARRDGPSESGGYTEADRVAFVEACTTGGGPAMAGTCRCAWERLVQVVPVDEYRRLDREPVTSVLSTVTGSSGSSRAPGSTSSGSEAGTPGSAPAPVVGAADALATLPPVVVPIVTDCLAREVLLPSAGTAPAATAPAATAPAGTARAATAPAGSADPAS